MAGGNRLAVSEGGRDDLDGQGVAEGDGAPVVRRGIVHDADAPAHGDGRRPHPGPGNLPFIIAARHLRDAGSAESEIPRQHPPRRVVCADGERLCLVHIERKAFLGQLDPRHSHRTAVAFPAAGRGDRGRAVADRGERPIGGDADD